MAEGEGKALREQVLELVFDYDEKGESKILGAIGGIKRALLSLGEAFAVYEIAEFVNSTVESVVRLGTETERTAQSVGISTQALQELSFVSRQAGVSQDTLATGLRFLSKNAFEAATKGGELSTKFAQLGVSVVGSNGKLKSADQLLAEVGDGLKNMKDQTARTALAQELLGRGGNQLLPVLLQGSAAIAQQRKEAEKYGVMSEHLIELTKDMEKATVRQEGAVQGARNAFAEELLPTLIELKKQSAEFMVKVLQPLARVLGKSLAKAIAIVERALDRISEALKPVTDWFSRLNTGLGGTVDLTDLLGVAIVGLAALLAAQAIKMAVSWMLANAPLILMAILIAAVATAIGLLIQDYLSDAPDSFFNTMKNGWNDLLAQTGSFPGAIAAMLDTAITFWDKFFANIYNNAQGVFGDLFRWLYDAFHNNLQLLADLFHGNLWQAVLDLGKLIGDWLIDPLKAVGHLIGIGNSNPAGVSSSSAVAPPAASGGTNVTTGGMSAVVNANITGVSQPEQVGPALQQHLHSFMEDERRQAIQSFVHAAVPVPGGG